MENKKSFGEYLRVKRKELNLTQKEFADKLFVTESAEIGRASCRERVLVTV